MKSPLSAVLNMMAAGTLKTDISEETLNFISMPARVDKQPWGSSACVTYIYSG